MSLTLGMLLGLSSALAGDRRPFVLPPGEDPADWSEALAMAGFALSPSAGGAGAEAVDEGSQWSLRVTDLAGEVHEAEIPEPRDARAREDTAWLARSLLLPAGEGVGWEDVDRINATASSAAPAAAPPPQPRRAPSSGPAPAQAVVALPPVPPPRAPVPTWGRAAPSAPALAASPALSSASGADTAPAAPDRAAVTGPDAAPPDGEIPSVTPKPAAPSEDRLPVRPPRASAVPADRPSATVGDRPPPIVEASVAAVPRAATRGAASISGGVGGGLALRPDTAVGGNLLACATLTLPPRVYLAVEGDLSLPTSLVRLEGDRAIYAWSASAGFGWAGRGPVSPRVGAVGGVSWRAFGQAGVLVGSGAVPFLGAHVDGGVPLTGIVRLWGWGEGLFDLRPTDLEVGSTKVRASPWAARLGIGFGLGRKSDG